MLSNAIPFSDSPAEAIMSPPREDRRVNAEQISFPLPMVLAMVAAIAATAFAVGGVQYLVTSSDRALLSQMQSDIRDIHTQMDAQSKIHELEKQLLDAQLTAMRSAIDNATNRAAALSMSQELSKMQNAQRGRLPN